MKGEMHYAGIKKMRGKSFRTMIVDDSNVWESLGQATDEYATTVNELVKSLEKFFGDLDKFIENMAEMEQHAISDQAHVEWSRQAVKQHSPSKLVQTYSFIPSAKKNLPYQRRKY